MMFPASQNPVSAPVSVGSAVRLNLQRGLATPGTYPFSSVIQQNDSNGTTISSAAMKYEDLVHFLEHQMSMSHVYQPLLVRAVVDPGGTATLRQSALRHPPEGPGRNPTDTEPSDGRQLLQILLQWLLAFAEQSL
jgi:hypothetical protein